MTKKMNPQIEPVKKENSLVASITKILERLRNRHERHYRDSYFYLWADLLLAGILVGLAISVVWLIIWQPRPEFSLEATIDSARVVSGNIHEFTIDYRNGESGPITAVAISLDLPQNFSVISASPADIFDSASNTFHIGDMSKGQRGQASIRGIVVGSPGDRQSLGLHADYQFSRVQKNLLDSLSYTIDASALALQLKVPERVYIGSNFSGELDVSNGGGGTLSGLRILFPSTDWEISFDEAPDGNNSLTVPSLAAAEHKPLTFTAKALKTGTFDLSAEASITYNQTELKQSTVSQPIIVAEPALSLTASLRQHAVSATAPSAPIDLSFVNNDSEPLEAISFTISVADKNSSVKSLSSSNKHITVRGLSLVYTPLLAGGKKDSVSAVVELERGHVETVDAVRLNVSVSYRLRGQDYEYMITAGNLKFNSNLSLSSAGYYYGPQGDQLGVGPIPPRVDIPTTYWVIWQVNNLGNEVKDMEVTADVPEGVAWPDQQSVTAGELSYSPVTRRVLWHPGGISQGGGNYRVSFALTLVPRSSDIGKVPKLLENIHFSGKDSFTGAQLSRDLPAITANIEADRLSAGKGTVLPTE